MIPTRNANRYAPQFGVLSDDQCEELYLAALQTLRQVGVQVRNAEARDLLAAAGADVDGDLVRVPRRIIEDALAVAPRDFTMWGRDGKHVMPVGLDQVNFGPGLTNTYFIDPQTGERRWTRRGDPAMTARVCDALDNLDYVIGLGLISDVIPELAPVYEFAELIANTTKPILAWAYNVENVRTIYRMAVAVAGSEDALRTRPFLGFFATFQSPLVHTQEDLANVMWAAEHDIPVIYIDGPIVGLTAPMTGASALVIHLAGILSGLAILQLKRRGAPVVLGGVPTPADLRTSRVSYGAPELSLYSAAAADLGRYLGVPFMGTAGASESKLFDSQATAEASIQALTLALSGAALVHDIGFLDGAETGSLALLVLADEIIDMVKRIMRGVEVNTDTIMLDLIEKVGPGGNFMAERQSAKLCRQEVWVPKLMDRNDYTTWKQNGSTSLEERVGRRLQKILNTHQPEPLDATVVKQLAALLAEAEERGKGNLR